MSGGFQVTRDLLTPNLKALARRVSNCRPVLEAMGLALVSVTRRAFNDDSMRPAPWPARPFFPFDGARRDPAGCGEQAAGAAAALKSGG